MKKILFIIFVLLSASCGDKLDLNPTTSIDSKDAKKSVDLMVAGAYAMIGSGPGTTGPNVQEGALYSTDLLLNADLLASENYMLWRGTFDQYKEVSNKLMSPTNASISRMWIKAYAAINLANTILISLNNAPEADRDRYKGHALFIRSIIEFELLRFWGEPSTDRGIPLVTQPTENLNLSNTPARASIEDCYAAIIADLTQAKSLLPEDDDVLADKYVAAAFLARVYLTKGDYANALTQADEVIQSGKYSLSASVEDAFNNRETVPETIFEIQQTTLNNSGTANDGLTTFYSCDLSTPGNAVRGDVGIDDAFIDSYEASDKRRTVLIYRGDCTKASVTSAKWKDPYANIPVVRLSEMYLIRAECNVRLNSNVGDSPLNDITAIRAKADASIPASVDLPYVLQERELELAFEGHRIHDFRRTGKTITYQSETVNYTDPQFILPIPQLEINTNKAITQNSYYQQ